MTSFFNQNNNQQVTEIISNDIQYNSLWCFPFVAMLDLIYEFKMNHNPTLGVNFPGGIFLPSVDYKIGRRWWVDHYKDIITTFILTTDINDL